MRQVLKVRKAPAGISYSILHPDYYVEKPNGRPIMPSNPHNTLRILPTLGPVAAAKEGRTCNRCERSHEGRFSVQLRLRPVTNLMFGSWDGLPDTATGEDNQAYICNSCLFPSCPDNRDWQNLEFRDGHYQATPTSQAALEAGPGCSAGGWDGTFPAKDASEDDTSSEGSDFPPRTPRRRKTPHAGTPTRGP
jgi:hypothetical protein